MVLNNLKSVRMKANLTQEELANAIGVTRQTIGLIENGKYNPSINLCINLCKTLNVTLNDIFGWGNEGK